MPEQEKSYLFEYNDKAKVINAYSLEAAKAEFMRRFGFYPVASNCTISYKKD